MRPTYVSVLAMVLALSTMPTDPAQAASMGRYEVQGVDEGDMLKLRGGPGTGFSVIVGLPNGTVLRVHECTQTGGTRWCKVSMDRVRAMRGYVSWAYLRKM